MKAASLPEAGPLEVERGAERVAGCSVDHLLTAIEGYPRHELRPRALVDCLRCPSPTDEAQVLFKGSGLGSHAYEIQGRLDPGLHLWEAQVHGGRRRNMQLSGPSGELVLRFANMGAPTTGLDVYVSATKSDCLQAMKARIDGTTRALSRVTESVFHAGFPDVSLPEGPAAYVLASTVDARNPDAFVDSEDDVLEVRIAFETSALAPFEVEVTLVAAFAPPLRPADSPEEHDPVSRATRQAWLVTPATR